jgi:amino acid adenylation domain-containing protein
MAMRIDAFLADSARRFPDKIALVCGDRRLSYATLDAAAARLAATLAARGAGRGERVVIFAENGWEAVVALFAAANAGAVFSLVNPTTKADKLGFILRNCRPAALVTQQRLAPVAAAALAEAPPVPCLVVAGDAAVLPGAIALDEALSEAAPPPPFPGIATDLAMLVYTSGSTGFAKGVMMTHANVAAASGSIIAYLGLAEDDVILCALPISFDYGLYQVLMSVRRGATLVLEPSFAFPQAVLATLAREGATCFPLVPTMAALLLQMRDLEPGAFPHLRTITNTAAALPPVHIARLQALFPATRIVSMYGLTECKRCTWLPPEELARRPGSVGIAIPGTEAWILREDGTRAAPDEVGELVIRGPHVMQGYWEDPAATARALRPGPYPWERVLHTGDLFRADAEGFLYFVGRKDDIIKSRGEKVSPKEVETVLYALPGVREAAVVGVPDPLLGMALKAILALEPGAAVTARDVIRHCAARLEDFMVPRQVEFRDALPKTDTGKISRRLLCTEEA